MSWRGVAGGICGEYRFLSDPQTEGLCSVEDILVDDLFVDDMKRSCLHRFGACIEGAVGNCLFDAAVDAFAQQIEDQILTTVGEGRDAIDHPVDVGENAPIVGFSELLIFLLAQAVEAEIVHELFPEIGRANVITQVTYSSTVCRLL